MNRPNLSTVLVPFQKKKLNIFLNDTYRDSYSTLILMHRVRRNLPVENISKCFNFERSQLYSFTLNQQLPK